MVKNVTLAMVLAGIGIVSGAGVYLASPQFSGQGQTPDKEEMPVDFAMNYTYGYGKSVLDTSQGIYIADRVCEDPVTIRIEFSRQEMQRIWDAVTENGFFDLPNLTDKCGGDEDCVVSLPTYRSTLNITAESKMHVVKYVQNPMLNREPDFIRYNNTVSVIEDVLSKQEEMQEIKKLPPPSCGYA